jgi:hypothetical protein
MCLYFPTHVAVKCAVGYGTKPEFAEFITAARRCFCVLKGSSWCAGSRSRTV